MENLSRIVWSEGMYLGPHHFQAQSSYFEDLVHFATSALSFESFGLVGYELDAEALRNGTLSLVHARGIFADGLTFHMPECDPPPAPRNIADLFPPTRETLGVSLAVPSRKKDGPNCAEEEIGPPTRYTAQVFSLYDENTGRDEKPVKLGRKNISFRLETESSEGFASLPLARVMRDGSGNYVYDPNFIPPCVQIMASEKLIMMTRRLVDILEEKSGQLSRTGQRGGKFSAGFSAQEVAGFWYLHSINTSLAPLRHLCLSKRGHPEELFVQLSRLAGALCTFKLDSHPRSLPLYDHQNLTQCFAELDQHIRTHLDLILPSNCLSVPLKPSKKYFYHGEITDDRIFGRSRWILAVRSEIGEADLVLRTSQLVKVCSVEHVQNLVVRALPGLTLTHLPVPPAAVSPKVEFQYFAVNKAGPCWDHIVKTKRVGIYVPGELPDPELELLVVLDV